jgi:SagB-type dehydrogenase family enzyme
MSSDRVIFALKFSCRTASPLCFNSSGKENPMRNSFLCILLLAATALTAQSSAPIALPAAVRTGGMTLNEALATRRSIRSYTAAPITLAEISQLLWSAQGITGDKGGRTAPSAHAQYFLHVYVARPEGFFEYIPASHSLQQLSGKDIRAALSTQDVVKNAPIVFLIAGEYERASKVTQAEVAHRLVNLEAGHAAQNMLLQATAMKLGAVPVGGVDAKQTAAAAALPADISPIYLVPVGHPKP